MAIRSENTQALSYDGLISRTAEYEVDTRYYTSKIQIYRLKLSPFCVVKYSRFSSGSMRFDSAFPRVRPDSPNLGTEIIR